MNKLTFIFVLFASLLIAVADPINQEDEVKEIPETRVVWFNVFCHHELVEEDGVFTFKIWLQPEGSEEKGVLGEFKSSEFAIGVFTTWRDGDGEVYRDVVFGNPDTEYQDNSGNIWYSFNLELIELLKEKFKVIEIKVEIDPSDKEPVPKPQPEERA